jgi:enamine deaminase RidA (YjgF/YER057c/UK114 family)
LSVGRFTPRFLCSRISIVIEGLTRHPIFAAFLYLFLARLLRATSERGPGTSFMSPECGIDPKTDALIKDDEERVRQAFMNMKLIAESEGATLRDAVRLVVYTTDMFRFRPLVNKLQSELWGQGPYPPRTIVEVHRLNQDDIVEVEGTFLAPVSRAAEPPDQMKFRSALIPPAVRGSWLG